MKALRKVGIGLIVALVAAVVVWLTVPAAAQEVSSQFRIQISVINRLLVGLRTVTSNLDEDYTQLFSHGTGANQNNAMWQSERTLAANGTETLDFSGTLTDDFGQSITCTKLKAVVVKAAAANTNNVLVGGASTTLASLTSTGALTNGLIVRPAGLLLWTFPDSTGAAVTAGSADLLQVSNSAGSTSVTYDIIAVCVE